MKKWSILILLILIAAFMMGCDHSIETTVPMTSTTLSAFPTDPTIPTEPPLFENVMFTRTEPYPYTKFYGGVNGMRFVCGNVTYYFEDGIPENQCVSILQKLEKGVIILEEMIGTAQEHCNVYILRNEYAPRAFEHDFYAGVNNLETQDMLVALIQAYYGYEVNYGLAYALSCEVAEAMEITHASELLPLEDALALIKEEPAFCDMNIACFSPVYASEQQIRRVKSLSSYVYSHLKAAELKALFTDYSDEQYCAYLNDFLETNGLSAYDNSDLSETVFFNGGNQTQIAWRNHIGEFYIENGYAITYPDAMFPEDMVNSGYTNLRKIVVDYIAQAEYVQEKLAAFEVNQAPLTILFMEDKVNASRGGGVFVSENSEIRLFAISPFLHEYTHYLTHGYFTGWKWEVLPTYYANYPVNEQINYIWYSDMLTYTSLDPNDPNDQLKYEVFEGVKAQLDHAFDWTSMEDYQYLLDAYIVKRGWLDRITNPTSGVATKSSFFYFLVKLENEESATAAMMEDAPEQYYGYSWNDLINLWKQDLNTRFAWVNA